MGNPDLDIGMSSDVSQLDQQLLAKQCRNRQDRDWSYDNLVIGKAGSDGPFC